jgi:hypothetical protein
LTYSSAVISGNETGEETSADIERRARVAVVASDDTVVLGLEVEFDNIALLSLDLIGLELVVAGGGDLDGLGTGEAGQSSRSEDGLERGHDDS